MKLNTINTELGRDIGTQMCLKLNEKGLWPDHHGLATGTTAS